MILLKIEDIKDHWLGLVSSSYLSDYIWSLDWCQNILLKIQGMWGFPVFCEGQSILYQMFNGLSQHCLTFLQLGRSL